MDDEFYAEGCCSICFEYYAGYEIIRCEKKKENYCKCCLQKCWESSMQPPGCRLCRNKYYFRCRENLYKDKFDFYKDTKTKRSWLESEEWLISKFRLSESSVNVRARTYIENKMSEAIIKTCTKCNIRFIKGEGCNVVGCICGNVICYICEKHPLQCGNGFDCLEPSAEVDEEKIMDAAEEAKKAVGSNLLIDPTICETSSVVFSRNRNNISIALIGSLLFYILFIKYNC